MHNQKRQETHSFSPPQTSQVPELTLRLGQFQLIAHQLLQHGPTLLRLCSQQRQELLPEVPIQICRPGPGLGPGAAARSAMLRQVQRQCCMSKVISESEREREGVTDIENFKGGWGWWFPLVFYQ